ncbi:DNA-binding transcriptional regulator, MocR family, contains an aminotransferase domain [Clostridium cavendishii DSM 21758]|uniref:DNA-binding transcriptional regulator, MocR family, contains an aminotransferase domain n=1 Tax=Clostridium cavendishii DSM 21758 TaxID=1121302 RepID=A0A1M6RAL7_9CLOT|nr:PLP-dependent aminotransferase family protein [Clostridium cavendishii]SHK29513.1 DNA-binding transcriptional regulator, MocR family, contains an aminotransferase domain [Clostridium cavendishii DSM 21758]
MDLIYKTIVKDLEEEIINNKYRAKKKLPSVRILCKKYNCSKNTVIKAYEELKSKHIVYAVPQSGYYIVEGIIGNNTQNKNVLDFSSGNPDINDLYIPDLKHCLDRSVDSYGNMSLNDNVLGIDSLRSILPSYLANFQVFTKKENIFVNLGIQQALSILTQMPFPNGKHIILIEQPTYSYFIQFLKFSKVETMTIERTEKGLDLDKLAFLFKNYDIKFFYTVTRNHNPLGTSLNKGQRIKIAELAKKYDVYIVEDDYFGDVDIDKYDPIYSYGDKKHHIYLKSYSKILPLIRIGISIIPTDLLDAFRKYLHFAYYYSYFSASLVSQATLEIYIKSNLLKKQTNSIKKDYLERSKILNKYYSKLKQQGIKCIGGSSGFYSYIQLPNNINPNILMHELESENIVIFNGKKYFLDEKLGEHGLRLSIARTNKEELEKGLKIISDKILTY